MTGQRETFGEKKKTGNPEKQKNLRLIYGPRSDGECDDWAEGDLW